MFCSLSVIHNINKNHAKQLHKINTGDVTDGCKNNVRQVSGHVLLLFNINIKLV